ncbi:vWA domain-containing protein [Aquabacterium sp. OR-4]|uniref:vWA domain-containing protein n=1 Tax=Aquabacterium sp. OR-4 TaxID=2978127 RepID=UPI0028C82458|nr:VWA domain-containing protein [Aquabacterium sp. OR-4]MDT7836122.1 VWA domain-containing protein [Aquabacterium sp. OR-4]
MPGPGAPPPARWPSGSGQGALAGIDWPATLYAKGQARLQPAHWRWRRTPPRPPRLQLILLDCSGSMHRQGRLALAKGWVLRLMAQATRRGDRLALIRFGGQGAECLLAPQAARRAMAVAVRPLGGGGGTPLAQALQLAATLCAGPAQVPSHTWLLSDGGADGPALPPRPPGRLLSVVDFDDPWAPTGQAAAWVAHWGASWLHAGAATGTTGSGAAASGATGSGPVPAPFPVAAP